MLEVIAAHLHHLAQRWRCVDHGDGFVKAELSLIFCARREQHLAERHLFVADRVIEAKATANHGGLARTVVSSCPVPLSKCAVLLEPQESPCQLDHAAADASVTCFGEPCSRRLRPLSSGEPVRPA